MEKEASSRAAESILGRIFRDLPFGFTARLWDGRQLQVGGEPCEPFTLVFRHAATFRRLMLRPNTLRFAEAFVEGDIDIEGDIFAAVQLAQRIEDLRLGVRDRVAIAARLLKM
jgi:cyclopropane-fatty-acyl-phospholipid synthase